MASFFKYNVFKNIYLKSGIDTLDKRERMVLAGGIVFVISFLVFQLVLIPFFNNRANVEKSIARKKDELVKIVQMEKEYRLLKSEAGSVRKKIIKRSPGFTLFTFLDRQATASKVKKQIKYMKPSKSEDNENLNQSAVEIKLQRVTLKSLVDFIRRVESVENVVSISRISIQESGNEQGYLDVIMRIMTFELKKI